MKALLLPLALLAACSSVPRGAELPADQARPYAVVYNERTETPPPAANAMVPGHAPTPFTAAEIQDALKLWGGRYFNLTGDPLYSKMQFTFNDVTAETTTVETMFYDHEGFTAEIMDEEGVRWVDLQAHASFPADQVTIGDGMAYVEAGDFDCWVYTHTPPALDGTPAGRSLFYFAKDVPGPPVYMASYAPDGTLAFEMHLWDYNKPE